MKLIIDIPENIIETIEDDQMLSREQLSVLQIHILDGISYEEQPQGDLISRDALRENVNAFYDSHFKGLVPTELIIYAKAVDDLIDNAPPVKTYCYFCGQTEHGQIKENYRKENQPADQWNLTEKTLPNKNGWYICTYEGICNRTVGVVGYDAIRKKWGRGGVIAWQNLPEPYKEN